MDEVNLASSSFDVLLLPLKNLEFHLLILQQLMIMHILVITLKLVSLVAIGAVWAHAVITGVKHVHLVLRSLKLCREVFECR